MLTVPLTAPNEYVPGVEMIFVVGSLPLPEPLPLPLESLPLELELLPLELLPLLPVFFLSEPVLGLSLAGSLLSVGTLTLAS
ncbi:hypothetical protein D3C73_1449970 [compost metagenome]